MTGILRTIELRGLMSQVTSQAHSALTLRPKAAVGCFGAEFFCVKSTVSVVVFGMMVLLQISRGGGGVVHKTDVSLEYTHSPEQHVSFSLV